MKPRYGCALCRKERFRFAHPVRPSTRRFKICCWQREHSASARRGLSACRLTCIRMRFCQSVIRGVVSGRFRLPLSEVVYEDRWGQPYPDIWITAMIIAQTEPNSAPSCRSPTTRVQNLRQRCRVNTICASPPAPDISAVPSRATQTAPIVTAASRRI
jgi:hypothetical protein